MRSVMGPLGVASYCVLLACSSSDGKKAGVTGGTGGTAVAGSSGVAAAGNAGMGAEAATSMAGSGGSGGQTAGSSGTSTSIAGRGAVTGGAAGSGGAGGGGGKGGGPSVGTGGSGDISTSPECAAYCAKVKECGKTCDPASDCAAPTGSCDQAHRAYIGCEAQVGSFYCTSDGLSVVSSCHEDTSVCPVVSVPDAGTCDVTPPDAACMACAKTPCAMQLATLQSDSELPDFRACVTACEKACNPAPACPPECSDSVVAFSDYTDLLYCANAACPDVCNGATVVF